MGDKGKYDDVKKEKRDSRMTGLLVVLLSVVIIGGMILATLSL